MCFCPAKARLALRVKHQYGYGWINRGRSSVVERQLPKLNVVGSIPIARSSLPESGLIDKLSLTRAAHIPKRTHGPWWRNW
jgi:hypothetical protein